MSTEAKPAQTNQSHSWVTAVKYFKFDSPFLFSVLRYLWLLFQCSCCLVSSKQAIYCRQSTLLASFKYIKETSQPFSAHFLFGMKQQSPDQRYGYNKYVNQVKLFRWACSNVPALLSQAQNTKRLQSKFACYSLCLSHLEYLAIESSSVGLFSFVSISVKHTRKQKSNINAVLLTVREVVNRLDLGGWLHGEGRWFKVGSDMADRCILCWRGEGGVKREKKGIHLIMRVSNHE